MFCHVRFIGPAATGLAIALLVGCDRTNDEPAMGREEGVAAKVRSNRTRDQGTYREVAVGQGGTVSGMVISNTGVRARLQPPRAGYPGCDSLGSAIATERGDGEPGNTLVWLADVRQGKPLPRSRLYAIENKGCELEPMMQGAIAGGTLNVKNSDRTQHRTRFLDAGSSTRAVVRQTDAGQVVPLADVLAHPGTIQIRCDFHPWTRAWMMVFDHPYFGLTERDGSFRIDSIPAGRYRLVAWHASLGRSEQDVDIKPGGGASVKVQIQF